MANVSIALLAGEAPRAVVLALDSGAQFVSLKLGDEASVIVPGVDAQCVAYLRALAAVMADAANQIERDRPSTVPDAVPPVPVDEEVIF